MPLTKVSNSSGSFVCLLDREEQFAAGASGLTERAVSIAEQLFRILYFHDLINLFYKSLII